MGILSMRKEERLIALLDLVTLHINHMFLNVTNHKHRVRSFEKVDRRQIRREVSIIRIHLLEFAKEGAELAKEGIEEDGARHCLLLLTLDSTKFVLALVLESLKTRRNIRIISGLTLDCIFGSRSINTRRIATLRGSQESVHAISTLAKEVGESQRENDSESLPAPSNPHGVRSPMTWADAPPV